jgi:hypothetical protein
MESVTEYLSTIWNTASTAASRMFLLDRETATNYTFIPQNKT